MTTCSPVMKRIVLLLVPAILAAAGQAQTVYVDARIGHDENDGTSDKPLKSIARAAAIVNSHTESVSATITIAPGIYSLDRCVTFPHNDRFTEQDRLTIQASILPDNPRWNPELMPVIVSVENPRATTGSGMARETYSFKIQTSHVTVQGLRFLGNPSPRNWHCCIERIGADLDDLLVTQCMFVGSRDIADIYCAALATGNRFVVDHCVFSGCHACTVFWDGLNGIDGKGCAVRHCIVNGAFISGVWTCQTAEDFAFHHNVIADSEYVWMRKPGDRQEYRINDCAFIDNKYLSGYGIATGPSGVTEPEVRFERRNVTAEGSLVWASEAKTHLAKESAGYELGAGLFTETSALQELTR
jgi:hypothetical protein